MHRHVKDWARVHVFRGSTALVTIVLLVLCFFYRPDVLTWWLRSTMTLVETGSSLLPYPWDDRLEIALRAIGGSFWFQITLAIIAVRVLAWLIAVLWRYRPSRRGRTMTEESQKSRER